MSDRENRPSSAVPLKKLSQAIILTLFATTFGFKCNAQESGFEVLMNAKEGVFGSSGGIEKIQKIYWGYRKNIGSENYVVAIVLSVGEGNGLSAENYKYTGAADQLAVLGAIFRNTNSELKGMLFPNSERDYPLPHEFERSLEEIVREHSEGSEVQILERIALSSDSTLCGGALVGPPSLFSSSKDGKILSEIGAGNSGEGAAVFRISKKCLVEYVK